MKIVEGKITGLLEKKLQYQVPIYQRKYSWEKSDCEKLLEDIIKVAEDAKRDKHFIGSVIYMSREETQNICTIDKYDLIDGQQRVATLSILLVALGDYTKECLSAEDYTKSNYSFDALKEDYLVNKRIDEDDEDYSKLRLTEEDDKAYQALINERKQPADMPKSLIFANYETFMKKLRKEHKTPDVIFSGIKKLTLGDVNLVPDDNAQLIFETVNSTGKQLDVVDKIRNFILMNADKSTQNRLYKNYWNPMEKSFGFDNAGRRILNDFMSYYVGIISQSKVPADYYDIFKSYFLGISKDAVEGVVSDIYDYSKCYLRLVKVDGTSKGFDRLLNNVKATGQWKVIPAILQIIHDLEKSTLEYEGAAEMVKIIETFIIRRQLCGLPSNVAGDAYVSIQKSVSSVLELKKCVNNLTGKKYMPGDADLRSKLHTRKLYGEFNRTRDILDRMEQYQNKDYTHTEMHNIEHIMPQTVQSHDVLYKRTDISDEKKLKLDWESDLGEDWRSIQKDYLDTIGNLTLTGYNSEYQNYRFAIKRDMEDIENGKRYGYKYTPINLSTSLASIDIWDKDAIVKRADEMIDIIIKIWPFPLFPVSE